MKDYLGNLPLLEQSKWNLSFNTTSEIYASNQKRQTSALLLILCSSSGTYSSPASYIWAM